MNNKSEMIIFHFVRNLIRRIVSCSLISVSDNFINIGSLVLLKENNFVQFEKLLLEFNL